VLSVESVEPTAGVPAEILLRSFLGEGKEVLRMSQPQPRSIARFLEPLVRVLPDRLEHPVPLVRETDKALLDERLQGVERCRADLVRGLERAPAAKDCQAGEEPLLLRRQQVVGPVDCCSQCLLAWVSVAATLQ
jgi:hypothetical protein